MEVFRAIYFLIIEEGLIRVEDALEKADPKTYPHLADEIMQHISILEESSNQIQLKRTREQLGAIEEYFKQVDGEQASRSDKELNKLVKFLRVCLERDLTEHAMYIPTLEQAGYYQQQKLFGDEVYETFELARNDVLEAGNCYATDNFTACVFHLMRVVEHGMRVLARRLKIKKVGSTALDFCDWGTVANALKSKVARLQQRRGRTAYKAMLLKRYAEAASHADYMNEIWRKDIAHARNRQPYNGPEALSVLTRVREFMQSVAAFLR